jgi:hypothetical protein
MMGGKSLSIYNFMTEAKKTTNINFAISPQNKQYLRLWAAEEEKTLSKLVEGIVSEAIENKKNKNKQ